MTDPIARVAPRRASRPARRPHRPTTASATAATVLAFAVAGTAPGVSAAAEVADRAAATSAPPECRCRAPGGALRDLGTVECVEIGGRRVSVRCEMSTNTPYWRRVEGVAACPAPA